MVDDSKGGKLTAEAIRRRIGLSTVAMPKDVAIGAKEMAMIGEAGITRIEISGEQGPQQYDHRNRKQVQEIKAECRKQGIRIVSVHGPSVPYDSPYEAVRRGAIEEAVASARAAEEMGGKTGKRFICEGDIELLNGLNHLKRIGIKNWVSKPKDTPHAIMYLNAAIKFFKNKYLLKCRR